METYTHLQVLTAEERNNCLGGRILPTGPILLPYLVIALIENLFSKAGEEAS